MSALPAAQEFGHAGYGPRAQTEMKRSIFVKGSKAVAENVTAQMAPVRLERQPNGKTQAGAKRPLGSLKGRFKVPDNHNELSRQALRSLLGEDE